MFLLETKTGRRQAVMVEEQAVAALLLALARAQDQRTAKLFPTPDKLRRVLARCLGALNVEAHGLAFVWHGFRHGGASRAFLRGDGPRRAVAATTSKAAASSSLPRTCRLR